MTAWKLVPAEPDWNMTTAAGSSIWGWALMGLLHTRRIEIVTGLDLSPRAPRETIEYITQSSTARGNPEQIQTFLTGVEGYLYSATSSHQKMGTFMSLAGNEGQQ